MRKVHALVLVTLVGLAGCSGATGGDGVPSFSDRLAQLPLLEGDETVLVSMADLAEAGSLADIEWPPADEDAVVDALLALSVPRGSQTAPVWVPLPEHANVDGAGGRQDEFAAAAGWSLQDLDWFAEVQAPPRQVMVGGGRVSTEALQAAHGGGDGPWRTGDQPDLEVDVTGDRLVDPLGRPVNLAVVDGVLGVSLTQEGLDALAGEGPTLADDEAVAELAALADDEGCYAVVVAIEGGTAQMVCQLPDLEGGAALLLAAAGWEDAEAAARAVEAALAEGLSVDRVPYEDVVTDVVVDSDAAAGTVTVRLRVVEDRPASLGQQLLLRRDPLVPGNDAPCVPPGDPRCAADPAEGDSTD